MSPDATQQRSRLPPQSDLGSADGYTRLYETVILQLPADALVAVKNNPENFSATVAHMLVRIGELSSEEHLMKIMNVFLAQDKPRTWLKVELEKLDTKETSTRATSNKPKVVFKEQFGDAGFYRQRSDGLVELTLNIAPDQVARFNESVLNLLNEYTTETQQNTDGG